MTLNQRISSFAALGSRFRRWKDLHDQGEADPDKRPGSQNVMANAIREAGIENPWFTPDQIHHAISYWGDALTKKKITTWLEPYMDSLTEYPGGKRIGVIMAGNIPMVGFHDMLTVLITGNRLIARVSSQDSRLLPAAMQSLVEEEPVWKDHVEFTAGEIGSPDAIIATGSNNSSRYFEYYFGKFPNIIRKNRTGVAILSGNESPEELDGIAQDVFLYFGLGCRSISKLYLPENYNFTPLHKAFLAYSDYFNHPKYRNNLDYYKSINMVNRRPFIDGGFYLLIEDQQLATPVSLLHYEYYESILSLNEKLQQVKDQVQCVVSHIPELNDAVSPGQSQMPALQDYADGVDTISFLLEKI